MHAHTQNNQNKRWDDWFPPINTESPPHSLTHTNATDGNETQSFSVCVSFRG
eukprot:m.245896 g.245896  ORF g.245896 m.245896 type:complete len:52 (+) comp66275_c0_seq1:215-370(+)